MENHGEVDITEFQEVPGRKNQGVHKGIEVKWYREKNNHSHIVMVNRKTKKIIPHSSKKATLPSNTETKIFDLSTGNEIARKKN
ncbi:MAG: hypothetical protein ACJAV6_000553 [Candidatus Paceibacteria bacterium]|jgi:hypothetical protein